MEDEKVLNNYEVVACTYIQEMINCKLLEIEENMDENNNLIRSDNGRITHKIRFWIEYIKEAEHRNSLVLLYKAGFKFKCIFDKMRSVKNCEVTGRIFYDEQDPCKIEFVIAVENLEVKNVGH